MNLTEIKASMNTVLMFLALMFSMIYSTNLGGPGSCFNSLIFVDLCLLVLLNASFRLGYFTIVFLPILSLFVSMIVNSSVMSSGAYHTISLMILSFLLLILDKVVFNKRAFEKLTMLMVVVCVVASIINYIPHFLSGQLSHTQNKNFNGNPNGAAIFFFCCLLMTLVNGKGALKLFLSLVLYVLGLTTGSRSCFILGASILLLWYQFDELVSQGKIRSSLLNKRKITIYFLLILIGLGVMYYLPNIFASLKHRIIASGVSLSAHGAHDIGRDQIWKEAIAVTFSNVKTILFGVGPGVIDQIVNRGMHSSYMYLLVSFGVISLISTLISILYLVFQEMRQKNPRFVLVALHILAYGVFESVLFNGLSNIWLIFIITYIYYRGYDVGVVQSDWDNPYSAMQNG